jgi:hypothetical protein
LFLQLVVTLTMSARIEREPQRVPFGSMGKHGCPLLRPE